MKTRQGFVSNSSSSSFVASLNRLSAAEYCAILEYCADPEQNTDGWSCYEDKEAGLLTGYTIMDNNAFSDWLQEVGINKVRFRE